VGVGVWEELGVVGGGPSPLPCGADGDGIDVDVICDVGGLVERWGEIITIVIRKSCYV
jgi:hypothetical protein